MKKVAVIAPANTMKVMPLEMRAIGTKTLEGLGYHVVFGNNIDAEKFHTAGTVHERLRDLNDALFDDSVEIIMPAFGGYNSSQLLDHIDFSAGTSRKKIIGFSDITALLHGFLRFSEIMVYHGPSFSVLCDPNLSSYTIHGLEAMISNNNYSYTAPHLIASDHWWLKDNYGPREWNASSGWIIYNPGIARGFITGGNTETLCALAGTKYFPEVKERILFLEDATGQSPAVFHRNLTQLRQMGVFEDISGLVIGAVPQHSPLASSDRLYYILDDVLEGVSNFPVLTNVNCSHVDPMMTIPFGKMAILQATDDPVIKVQFDDLIPL